MNNDESFDPVSFPESEYRALKEDCPLEFIGVRGGSYIFTKPSGEEYILTESRLGTRMGVLSLFGGDLQWVHRNFPSHGRKGKPDGGFDMEELTTFLVWACEDEGIADNASQIRAQGTWKDDELGLVTNCGDAILTSNGWRRPGLKTKNGIYIAASKTKRPADKAAEPEAGWDVRNVLQCWNFDHPGQVDLVVGFIGFSYIAGAVSWRPHMIVTGKAGTGKSTLATYISALLGGTALPLINNATEAGIRQAMARSSRILILDEAENEQGSSFSYKVLQLCRQLSSGLGAHILRGSAGGDVQAFHAAGAALILSIIQFYLKPQDRGRVTNVGLKAIEDIDPERLNFIHQKIQEAHELSGALWRRAIDNFALYQTNLDLYRRAILMRGYDNRVADQVAALLAGRDMLLHDSSPDSDSIDEMLERVSFLFDDANEQQQENEGILCLEHLYSTSFEMFRGCERQPISQVIYKALEEGDSEARKALATIGIKVVYHHDRSRRKLIIANRHAGLEQIFTGTPWANKVWGQVFRYIDGSEASTPFKLANASFRGRIIPQDAWPSSDSFEDEGDE